jgi:hypothetical protein
MLWSSDIGMCFCSSNLGAHSRPHTVLIHILVHTYLDPDIIFGVETGRGEMVWKIGDLQRAYK